MGTQTIPMIAALVIFLPPSGRGEEPTAGPSVEPDLRVLSTRADGVVRVRLGPGLLTSGRLPRPADAPEGPVPVAFRLHRLLPVLDPDLETDDSGPHEIAELAPGAPEADLFAGDEGFPPGPWRVTLHAVTDGVPADAEIAGARFWRGRVEDWASGIEKEYASLRALLEQWKGGGDPEDDALAAGAGEYVWFADFPIHLRNRYREEANAAFRADLLSGRVAPKSPAGADSKREKPEWITPKIAAKLEAGGAAGAGKGPAADTPVADDKRDLLARTALGHVLLAAEAVAGSAADGRLRDLGSSSAASAFTDWARLSEVHGRFLAADPAYGRVCAAQFVAELWRSAPASSSDAAAPGAWKSAAARAAALRAGIFGKS